MNWNEVEQNMSSNSPSGHQENRLQSTPQTPRPLPGWKGHHHPEAEIGLPSGHSYVFVPTDREFTCIHPVSWKRILSVNWLIGICLTSAQWYFSSERSICLLKLFKLNASWNFLRVIILLLTHQLQHVNRNLIQLQHVNRNLIQLQHVNRNFIQLQHVNRNLIQLQHVNRNLIQLQHLIETLYNYNT